MKNSKLYQTGSHGPKSVGPGPGRENLGEVFIENRSARQTVKLALQNDWFQNWDDFLANQDWKLIYKIILIQLIFLSPEILAENYLKLRWI